jgi:hypothetical protein
MRFQEDHGRRVEEDLQVVSCFFSTREAISVSHGMLMLLIWRRPPPKVNSGVVIILVHGTAVESQGLPLFNSVRATVAFQDMDLHI